MNELDLDLNALSLEEPEAPSSDESSLVSDYSSSEDEWLDCKPVQSTLLTLPEDAIRPRENPPSRLEGRWDRLAGGGGATRSNLRRLRRSNSGAAAPRSV